MASYKPRILGGPTADMVEGVKTDLQARHKFGKN